ncbi:MAG: LLM class flavin-dependent oxidoreductase [Euryarchaeota archaeon]|nr:LLM class flavin-dependent oxidoreductase [Euryarchaeota archaeon]
MKSENGFLLGLDTFGDVTRGSDGKYLKQHEVLRNVVEEAVLADELGLDFFGVGEHHRDDFAVSAPEVVLGAIASRTERIHLGSAVTVLNSDDPVRVYERFATIDGLSNGRAEVILGRGSFTESFPLFGIPMEQYDLQFAEKLEIFSQLRNESALEWEGTIRPPLTGQRAYPTTEKGSLMTWIGVGGSPDSVIRAASYGIPLCLAIIGGQPARFAQFSELYLRSLERFGHSPQPISCHSPGHVAETDAEAKEQVWPHYRELFSRIGRERGWPPVTYEQFEYAAGPDGSMYVGSPETVAEKIIRNARLLNLSRFNMKYSNGGMPHEQLMSSIELYANEVAPIVRDALKE